MRDSTLRLVRADPAVLALGCDGALPPSSLATLLSRRGGLSRAAVAELVRSGALTLPELEALDARRTARRDERRAARYERHAARRAAKAEPAASASASASADESKVDVGAAVARERARESADAAVVAEAAAVAMRESDPMAVLGRGMALIAITAALPRLRARAQQLHSNAESVEKNSGESVTASNSTPSTGVVPEAKHRDASVSAAETVTTDSNAALSVEQARAMFSAVLHRMVSPSPPMSLPFAPATATQLTTSAKVGVATWAAAARFLPLGPL